MCYTTTEEYLNIVSLKYMDFDIFKKIIDEIAGKVFAIRLSLRGEPLYTNNLLTQFVMQKIKVFLKYHH